MEYAVLFCSLILTCTCTQIILVGQHLYYQYAYGHSSNVFIVINCAIDDAGMQLHTNGICIVLSNRYENAVLNITITG